MSVDEALRRAGLHIDELNKLRVLEPEISQENADLKEECHDFTQKVNDFQTIIETISEMMNNVAKEVEKEKMKAIGARNLLKSVSKQRESKQQQLKALIVEKKMEHERLRKQYESLQKVEAEQNDFIEQFLLQK